MGKEFDDNLKINLSIFCDNLFNIVQKNHKIYCFVIQYHTGQILIGTSKNGSFIPKYYDPNSNYNIPEISTFILNNINKQCILNTFEYINIRYPNNKYKSFNIFYNNKKKSINICNNRIGSKAIYKCRLFDEFKLFKIF